MAKIPDKWLDPATELNLRAWAIDQNNLDIVRGEIPHIRPSGCKLTEGYYTDTRVSAALVVEDPTFDQHSWIRLEAVDSKGGAEELGTFYIGPIESTESGRGRIVQYTLKSTIASFTSNCVDSHWIVDEGTKVSTAIARACNYIGRPYVLLPGFNDWTMGGVAPYDIGDEISHILFDLCERTSNRMGVDGHGRLTFGPYTAPAQRGVDWELDERDSRSIIMSVDVKEQDETSEAYARSLVVWKGRVNEGDEDDTEITGQANVANNHSASVANRGYLRVKVHNETELAPATGDRATQLAKQYLIEDSYVAITASMTVMWCPIHAGDIISLTRLDGTTRRWLVQTVEANLANWTKKLTLKEA